MMIGGGKPKYSEKICPSARLYSHTHTHSCDIQCAVTEPVPPLTEALVSEPDLWHGDTVSTCFRLGEV
jgi:hypothetical protein